ncbi:MAG: MarR family transcriptional regulator [Alphaproteobacteria bacterium]|nr:MarR family transcriptional regulator [Alphaproteobacteria bacterium]
MDLDIRFGLQVGQVSRKWRTCLNARLKHTGLSEARWIALLRLSLLGPIAQGDLADQIGIRGPTLVRLLDALERQGLIERKSGAGDRRVKRIHLTRKAQPVLRRITTISDRLRAELMAGIRPGDLETAYRVLRTIGDRLEAK